MQAEHKRYRCDFDVSLRHEAGVRPPLLYEYPAPPSSVRLLFLGWNPPKPYGGFWSLDQRDNLRRDLHWILRSARRVTAEAPDGTFLTEFAEEKVITMDQERMALRVKQAGDDAAHGQPIDASRTRSSLAALRGLIEALYD